jgi:hypothetical protein
MTKKSEKARDEIYELFNQKPPSRKLRKKWSDLIKRLNKKQEQQHDRNK